MQKAELDERIRKWREGVKLLRSGQLAESQRAALAFDLWNQGKVISRALTMLGAGYTEILSDNGVYEWKKVRSQNGMHS